MLDLEKKQRYGMHQATQNWNPGHVYPYGSGGVAQMQHGPHPPPRCPDMLGPTVYPHQHGPHPPPDGWSHSGPPQLCGEKWHVHEGRPTAMFTQCHSDRKNTGGMMVEEVAECEHTYEMHYNHGNRAGHGAMMTGYPGENWVAKAL
ncbi:hypothetical protein SAY86_031455 [Trapa natans]|uniref:Uncharacterized protein n=1 Tax=Trapa natans TaxID=22666 RepID=A0AAN7R5W7_TRANT|nr:hypothetical protein SAY86_031455 [Trapa natans]